MADSRKIPFHKAGLHFVFFCLLMQMLPIFYTGSNPLQNDNNITHIAFSLKKETKKADFLKDCIPFFCEEEEDEETRLEKSKKQKDYFSLFNRQDQILLANIFKKSETDFERDFKNVPLYLFFNSWKVGLQTLEA